MKLTIRLSIALAIVAALVVTSSASSQVTSGVVEGCTLQQAFAARGITRVTVLEEQVLAAINSLRHQHGLVTLRLNARLTATAREHSLSMAEHGYFEHSSITGSPFWKRIHAKYPQRGGRFWSVGENMAWGSPDLSTRQVLHLWLRSSPHAKNLLTRAFREIGLGAVHALAAPGAYKGHTVTILTVDFGIRR